MTDKALVDHLAGELEELKRTGLFKPEHVIASPQGAAIRLADGRKVLNFCANNYLGLADHPDLVAAANAALDRYGFGMASVRFICGTQEEHKQLEKRIAGSSATRTPSSTRPASTPTPACSRPFSAKRTRLSPTR